MVNAYGCGVHGHWPTSHGTNIPCLHVLLLTSPRPSPTLFSILAQTCPFLPWQFGIAFAYDSHLKPKPNTIFTYAFLKKKKKKKNQSALLTCVKNLQSMGLKTQKHADYIYHPNCFFSLNSQHSFIISRFVGHKKVSALTIVGLFYSYSFSYIVDCGLSNSTSFSIFPLQRELQQRVGHLNLKTIFA
jgi:hypothetical protein